MKAVHCPKCCTYTVLPDAAPPHTPCLLCTDWQVEYMLSFAFVKDAKGNPYWRALAFPTRDFIRTH